MTTWRHLLNESSGFACQESGEGLVGIIGLPMDWTTSYMPGTRFAPRRIRDAACNIELYSVLTGRSLDDYGYIDLGDVALPMGDVAESLRRIEIVARGFREDYPDKVPVFIGGEHLVTYPVVEAVGDGIDYYVVFDAHGDLRDDYLGVKYSHATVNRRIHEDFDIPVIIIGGRAFSKEEVDYIGGHNDIVVITLRYTEDTNEALRRIEGLLADRNVYVSIDMDVFDPGYAPGVSNPEPLGLSPMVVLGFLERIVRASRRIMGFDVVEVNPLRDVNDVTSILAAKLIIEFYGLLLDGLH